MTRLLTLVALVLLMMTLLVSPVAAQMPSPGGGNAFGEHIAGMAPEHPQLHGPDVWGVREHHGADRLLSSPLMTEFERSFLGWAARAPAGSPAAATDRR